MVTLSGNGSKQDLSYSKKNRGFDRIVIIHKNPHLLDSATYTINNNIHAGLFF